jgi:hypothetical protein
MPAFLPRHARTLQATTIESTLLAIRCDKSPLTWTWQYATACDQGLVRDANAPRFVAIWIAVDRPLAYDAEQSFEARALLLPRPTTVHGES